MDLFLTLFIILFPIIGGIGVYFIGNKVEKVREILAISITTSNELVTAKEGTVNKRSSRSLPLTSVLLSGMILFVIFSSCFVNGNKIHVVKILKIQENK